MGKVVGFILLLVLGGVCRLSGDNEYFIKAERLKLQGLYQEALNNYAVLLAPQTEYKLNGDELRGALFCLYQLDRLEDFDRTVENAVAAHPDSSPTLLAAADAYGTVAHDGHFQDGRFLRGYRYSGGRYANAYRHDRVLSIRYYLKTLALLKNPREPGVIIDRAAFFRNFAHAIYRPEENWRLQYLTDLDKLPDYDDSHYPFDNSNNGAPVNPDGSPLFYALPNSFEAARNDGERWRWLLAQQADNGDSAGSKLDWADFLCHSFGVRTMAAGDISARSQAMIEAVKKLSDSETMACLSNGIRKFSLPDEFNYLQIYRELAESGNQEARRRLVDVYLDRCRYDRAAELLRRWNQLADPTVTADDITAGRAYVLPVAVQAAGTPARIVIRYRNAEHAVFFLRKIEMKKLLNDLRETLRQNPPAVSQPPLRLEDIGSRLVASDNAPYLGAEMAKWQVSLSPGKEHFDRTAEINMPRVAPGAYRLQIELPDGYRCYSVLWLSNLVLLNKNLDDRIVYYVADAGTGIPVPGVRLSFFGFRQLPLDSPEALPNSKEKRRFNIVCREFELTSDKDGLVSGNEKKLSPYFSWLVEANGAGDKFGVLGFGSIWYDRRSDYDANRKIYCVTDRPVYRPGQKVCFNAWGALASYTHDGNPFAGADLNVRLFDPQDQELLVKDFKADSYGGINGSFILPKNAGLGVYTIRIANNGFSSFRVEEYKKNEFEVKVEAPSTVLRSDRNFRFNIRAQYYWGAPVSGGMVKYKIERGPLLEYWFPPSPWQWLYGKGYWWQGIAYPWLPGWNEWGAGVPAPSWRNLPVTPPELIASGNALLNADGSFSVPVDTMDGTASDVDWNYHLTVEVTDSSRRLVAGEGNVSVTAQPFKVFCWPHRGYFLAGDTARIQITTRTIDGIPVLCNGVAELYRLATNKDGKLEKRLVATAPVEPPNAESSVKFKIDQAGQYQLNCVMKNGNHTVTGGYVFVVLGDNNFNKELETARFNPIELVCDRQEYKPGDTVNLLINTDKVGATVLLLVRSSGKSEPEVLRLVGKNMVKEIRVEAGDIPNFFIEAYTVADGQIYQAVTQVAVPPEKKILGLEVLPGSTRLTPGEDTVCKLKVTDQRGVPVVGSVTVTVYDRALEYLAHDHYCDIRKFFWEWTRYPQLDFRSNLLTFFNLYPPGQRGMLPLGCFGQGPEELPLFLDGRMAKERGRDEEQPVAMAAADNVARSLGMDKAGAAGMAETPPPVVRSYFADTAFWAARLSTDKDGIAEIKFRIPENLTAWKIRAWVMGENACVGEGEADIITARDFLVRLQLPRFLVVSDRTVCSAIVHNYLPSDKKTRISLSIKGDAVKLLAPSEVPVVMAKNSEVRADWLTEAVKEGNAAITVQARTDDGTGDAMKLDLPVSVRGTRQQLSFCGGIAADGGKNSAAIEFEVPSGFQPEETQFQVNYSPSIAGAILESLPYLASYPYGCTEQTLNRFLPSLTVARTLRSLELTLPQLADNNADLNPDEIGDTAERREQWQRWKKQPVFNDRELDRMVADGLKRLLQMQLSDGGWGWFSGGGETSDVHLTAQVMRGLLAARAAGLYVNGTVIKNGLDWLIQYQQKQLALLDNVKAARTDCKLYADDLDALVFMVLTDAEIRSDKMERMRVYLFRDRLQLSVYGRILLALSLQKLKENEQLRTVLSNLREYLEVNKENHTCRLNMGKDNWWWQWQGDRNEAMAYYLRLLCRSGAKEDMTVAAGLVKYMVANRKHATYWNSTRDTALCVEAICEYLQTSGEFEPNMALSILLDGKLLRKVTINKSNLFNFDSSLLLTGKEIGVGKHRLELLREGSGPVFFNAFLTGFNRGANLSALGTELQVSRNYYLVRESRREVQVNNQGAAGFVVRSDEERVKLSPPFHFQTGEVVEVELLVKSANDYEYIMLEDRKPAGLEAISERSGYEGGAYVEYRDRKVTFFLRTLSQGTHCYTYRLRAEFPGVYNALPARGEAMYAPELQGNSAAVMVQVEEKMNSNSNSKSKQ